MVNTSLLERVIELSSSNPYKSLPSNPRTIPAPNSSDTSNSDSGDAYHNTASISISSHLSDDDPTKGDLSILFDLVNSSAQNTSQNGTNEALVNHQFPVTGINQSSSLHSPLAPDHLWSNGDDDETFDTDLSLPFNNQVPWNPIEEFIYMSSANSGNSRFYTNLEGKTRGRSGIYFDLGGHKSKSYVNCLTYQVKKKFNELPLCHRSSANYQGFKDNVKTYLKSLDDNFPT